MGLQPPNTKYEVRRAKSEERRSKKANREEFFRSSTFALRTLYLFDSEQSREITSQPSQPLSQWARGERDNHDTEKSAYHGNHGPGWFLLGRASDRQRIRSS